MLRKRRLFYVLIISLLVSGCAARAGAASDQGRSVESPVPLGGLSQTTNTVEPVGPESMPHDPPDDCPVTRQQDPPFAPPAPYASMGDEGEFWYGTDSLWTAVREDGIWEALPHNPGGYTQKVFWWRDGYVWTNEPEPELFVTAERLDAPAPPIRASKATNAYANDIGSAMLVGIDLPSLGCWKITGKYADTELGFVVWVAP